jgi:protein tyrosine phosphatase (PTP) superfamily phosphohydrolase (DUF442 family)
MRPAPVRAKKEPERRYRYGGAMKNEAVVGGITVAGQPTEDELRSGRFTKIVNVRGDAEPGNITRDVLAGSDVSYTSVPFTIDTVTNDDIRRIRDAIGDTTDGVLLH